MPHARTRSAQLVADILLPLEGAAAQATEDRFRLVATLMEQRRKARIPFDEAASVLRAVRRGAELSADADELLMSAHAELAGLAQKYGVAPTSYGDDGPCIPEPSGKLPILAVVSNAA